MSLMIKDKQLFKSYSKIQENIESLMRKKFDSKPFYGNDDNSKDIKMKRKIFKDRIFMIKKCLKNTIQVFINNSVRF